MEGCMDFSTFKKVLNIPHIKPYIESAELTAMNEYLRSGGYLTEYHHTKYLESIIEKFLTVKHVSMVPNGTSALYLSLLASEIGPGDEVLVPDYTMIAVPNAVRMVGAKPKLIDVEEDTHCMDIKKARVTKKTKAMIYVDINGRSGNMSKVRGFCRKHKLILIEDACQSLGSKHKGEYLGRSGRFNCFSLGFHKIVTTGQGGFIAMRSKGDYDKIERLKDFGRIKGGNDKHDYLGFNFKFTDLQAVIGIEQMKTIKWRMDRKREIYKQYHEGEAPEGYVPWFIEYEVKGRDTLYTKLTRKGIGCRKLYPPVHTQKIYTGGKFPISDKISRRGIWLPSSLDLKEDEINQIKDIVHAYTQGH